MSRGLKLATIFICLGTMILSAKLAEAGRRGPWSPPASGTTCEQVLDEAFDHLAASQLDEHTSYDIVLLREEEKMARDFYLTMSLIYESPVFSNIARSEQRHMDLVWKMIDRFGLQDPAEGTAIGEFEDEWVQSTFDELVSIGKESLVDALWAAASIEDLDIYRLDQMSKRCANLMFCDVGLIVQNINAGSRDHLRSFAGALLKREITYECRYITQERLDEILNSKLETVAVLDENGDVIAECGLAGGSRR